MIEILEVISLSLFPAFLLLETFAKPRQKFKEPKNWKIRTFTVSVLIIVASLGLVSVLAKLFGDYHLLNGAALGSIGGALVGIFVYEFGHYWYHRLAHRSDLLFFAGHQMHHSAESLDCWGAYYLHPLDRGIFVTMLSIVMFPLLGLSTEAAAIVVVWSSFNSMFQHINIKTPKWLGYIVQRPEQHIIHHGRNIHRYNYCDLPFWDIVFKTFKNPTAEEVANIRGGFYDGSSTRLLEMLLGQDVTHSKEPNALPNTQETEFSGSVPLAN